MEQFMIMKFHYQNYLPNKNKYINYFIKPNIGCLFEKVKANLQKERELSLSYINSYAQTKKDDLENQIKLSRLSHEKLDIFINSFYLIKKDHKLFDKYEIFKTNISLLFFEKVKRN